MSHSICWWSYFPQVICHHFLSVQASYLFMFNNACIRSWLDYNGGRTLSCPKNDICTLSIVHLLVIWLTPSFVCPSDLGMSSCTMHSWPCWYWYVIEITGQSAGTATIQMHSLLHYQLCLTHQQCRGASLLESPSVWLFAKFFGASAQKRIPPFVVRTHEYEIKSLILYRLS